MPCSGSKRCGWQTKTTAVLLLAGTCGFSHVRPSTNGAWETTFLFGFGPIFMRELFVLGSVVTYLAARSMFAKVWNEIPHTSTGKIDKKVIRAKLQEAPLEVVFVGVVWRFVVYCR